MFIKTLVLSGLATVGSAHVLMTNPVPFGKSTLSNSPLNADGSDFPCKMRKGVYDRSANNVYEQGSTQRLALQGSAVHGGGSCQLSITTDLEPDKNSDWRTFKSIEGGCPAKGVVGNLDGGPGLEGPNKYDFTIPKELASGNYTLAWTWFNKVGNREMYMNCAPLTVTGSGGSSSFLSTLPNMFVANLGNGCSTKETTDLEFPNPGKDVDRFNGATSVFLGPLGDAACQQPTGGNGGGPSPTAGQPAPTKAPAATSKVTQAPAPSANRPTKSSKTLPGGAFITVSSKQPAATIVAPSNGTAPSGTKVSQPAAPTSAVPNPAPSSGNGGGNAPSTGHAAYTPCTSEGSWNCIGGTSFQRCASGTWSPVLGMPAGVSCTPGESAVIEMMNAKNTKRAMRAMRRSLRFNA